MTLGNALPLRVSLALGAANASLLSKEVSKLDALLASDTRRPDILVDLSRGRPKSRLYEEMIDRFPGPVGFVPLYHCTYQGRSDDSCLLSEIQRSIQAGISHITIHPTATWDLWQLALSCRQVPTTSCGGGIVIADMLSRRSHRNVFQRVWSRLLDIVSNTQVAVSIGAVFRPASTSQALDDVHVQETHLQTQICQDLHSRGIPVIREGVGHAHIHSLRQYSALLRQQSLRPPLMTLGPLAIDHAISRESIAVAAAATALAEDDSFSVMQIVTAREHIGGLPTTDELLEALADARLIADAVNMTRGFTALSTKVTLQREHRSSCVVWPLTTPSSDRNPRHSSKLTCQRCFDTCPLRLSKHSGHDPVYSLVRHALPPELVDETLVMIARLRSCCPGEIAIFGSTAQRRFCYARVDNSLRLESDLELNIILDSSPSQSMVTAAESAAIWLTDRLGASQPIFDVDVRVRTREYLSRLPYNSSYRRTLYSMTFDDTTHPLPCPCSETDMSTADFLPHDLRSATEWAILRLSYLNVAKQRDIDWWLAAIRASLICKLSRILMHDLGVPCQAGPSDVDVIRRACRSPQDRKCADDLHLAWRQRMDRSGRILSDMPIPHTSVSSWLRVCQGILEDNALWDDSLCRWTGLLEHEEQWHHPTDAWLDEARQLFRHLFVAERGRSRLFEHKYRRCLGRM